jgi:hypothetical protein
LNEVRASDLRFTSSEAAEFLKRAMGLDLSPEDVAALQRRTEGWIAGLQLAALALQGTGSIPGGKDTSSSIRSFTGSHRYVLDYLVEEVLEQQSAGVQCGHRVFPGLGNTQRLDRTFCLHADHREWILIGTSDSRWDNCCSRLQGSELAGDIEAEGRDVERFKEGDQIY